jgi:hypothetical protein
MEHIVLSREKLNQFKLRNEEFLVDGSYYHEPCGKQEYRLYSYLSTLFDDTIILDIGTLTGRSAVALSHNENNKVISYNVVDQIKNPQHPIYKKSNIEFRIGNVLDDLTPELVSGCNLVIIDIYHQGKEELEIIKRLDELCFSGMIILDDIYHPRPKFRRAMKRLWKSLLYQKYDLTKYGHHSGTGLILMNCDRHLTLQ